jgi:pimeloyl-ACP methyl ester carboxylesterase
MQLTDRTTVAKVPLTGLSSEHGADITRLFPASTIEVVAGAGHWVHAEAPDAFIAVLSGFLAA